jgi:hypothetical protein
MDVIHEETGKGKGVLVHHNNSLLYGRFIAPGVVEAHLLTEDSPLQLLNSLTFFVDHGRKLGVHTLYGNADNPSIIKLLKKTGVDVQSSDKPHYNWKANL